MLNNFSFQFNSIQIQIKQAAAGADTDVVDQLINFAAVLNNKNIMQTQCATGPGELVRGRRTGLRKYLHSV